MWRDGSSGSLADDQARIRRLEQEEEDETQWHVPPREWPAMVHKCSLWSFDVVHIWGKLRTGMDVTFKVLCKCLTNFVILWLPASWVSKSNIISWNGYLSKRFKTCSAYSWSWPFDSVVWNVTKTYQQWATVENTGNSNYASAYGAYVPKTVRTMESFYAFTVPLTDMTMLKLGLQISWCSYGHIWIAFIFCESRMVLGMRFTFTPRVL